MDDAVGPERVCQCQTLDDCIADNKLGMKSLKNCDVEKAKCIAANQTSMQSLLRHEAEIKRMQIALIERDRSISECNASGNAVLSQLREHQALLREREQQLSNFLKKGRDIESRLNACTHALVLAQSQSSQSQAQVSIGDEKMKCGHKTVKGGNCNHLANSCPHHYKH